MTVGALGGLFSPATTNLGGMVAPTVGPAIAGAGAGAGAVASGVGSGVANVSSLAGGGIANASSLSSLFGNLAPALGPLAFFGGMIPGIVSAFTAPKNEESFDRGLREQGLNYLINTVNNKISPPISNLVRGKMVPGHANRGTVFSPSSNLVGGEGGGYFTKQALTDRVGHPTGQYVYNPITRDQDRAIQQWLSARDTRSRALAMLGVSDPYTESLSTGQWATKAYPEEIFDQQGNLLPGKTPFDEQGNWKQGFDALQWEAFQSGGRAEKLLMQAYPELANDIQSAGIMGYTNIPKFMQLLREDIANRSTQSSPQAQETPPIQEQPLSSVSQDSDVSPEVTETPTLETQAPGAMLDHIFQQPEVQPQIPQSQPEIPFIQEMPLQQNVQPINELFPQQQETPPSIPDMPLENAPPAQIPEAPATPEPALEPPQALPEIPSIQDMPMPPPPPSISDLFPNIQQPEVPGQQIPNIQDQPFEEPLAVPLPDTLAVPDSPFPDSGPANMPPTQGQIPMQQFPDFEEPKTPKKNKDFPDLPEQQQQQPMDFMFPDFPQQDFQPGEGQTSGFSENSAYGGNQMSPVMPGLSSQSTQAFSQQASGSNQNQQPGQEMYQPLGMNDLWSNFLRF